MKTLVTHERDPRRIAAKVAATMLTCSLASFLTAKEPNVSAAAPVIVRQSSTAPESANNHESGTVESGTSARQTKNEAKVIRVLPGVRGLKKVQALTGEPVVRGAELPPVVRTTRPNAPIPGVTQTHQTEATIVRQSRGNTLPVPEPTRGHSRNEAPVVKSIPRTIAKAEVPVIRSGPVAIAPNTSDQTDKRARNEAPVVKSSPSTIAQTEVPVIRSGPDAIAPNTREETHERARNEAPVVKSSPSTIAQAEVPVIRSEPDAIAPNTSEETHERARNEAPVVKSSPSTIAQTEVPVIRSGPVAIAPNTREETHKRARNEALVVKSSPSTAGKAEVPVIRNGPVATEPAFRDQTQELPPIEAPVAKSIPASIANAGVPVIRNAPAGTALESLAKTEELPRVAAPVIKSLPGSIAKAEVPVIRSAANDSTESVDSDSVQPQSEAGYSPLSTNRLRNVTSRPEAPAIWSPSMQEFAEIRERSGDQDIHEETNASVRNENVSNSAIASTPTPGSAPIAAVTRRPFHSSKSRTSSIEGKRENNLRFQSGGKLTLGVREIGSLRPGSRVARFEIENDAICNGSHSEPSEIAVVGKAPGHTRIAVWLEEVSVPLVWNVCVSEPKPLMSGVEDNEDLLAFLADRYPHSTIRLKSSDGELIVEGKAKDRKEAIQILSFIRSVRLVPVVDHVVVATRQ